MLIGPAAIERARPSWMKPPGEATLSPQSGLRSLQLSFPCTSIAAREVANGIPFSARSGVVPGITPYGQGIAFAASNTNYISYIRRTQAPLNYSLEALVYYNATPANGWIMGFQQSNDGTGVDDDRSIGYNSTGNTFFGYGFTSAALIVQSASGIVAGKLYHIVLTGRSGTGITLYVNMVPTTASSGTAFFAGYPLPMFLILGNTTRTDSPNYFHCITASNHVLLMANQADVAWSAAEVNARYNSLFGIFNFSEDQIWSSINSLSYAPILARSMSSAPGGSRNFVGL